MEKADELIGIESESGGWKISLFWTSANILAISGGVFVGTLLNVFLWPPLISPNKDIVSTYFIQRAVVDGLIIGIFSGFLQWVVLQRFQLKWRNWILASIAGWTVGVTLATVTDRAMVDFSMITGYLLGGAVIGSLLGGASIGFSQWLILRHYLPKAYWWIIINSVGCFAITIEIPLGDGYAMSLESFTRFLFPGLILGVMTSVTLSWLLSLYWLEQYNKSA